MNMNIDELKLILLNNSVSEVKAALNDFDLASFDRNGNNILHYYVMSRASFKMPVETIIQLFIDFEININANQSKMAKRTALHLAVLKKSKDVFDILLNKGADVNKKDGDGKVPLSEAVFVYRGDDGYFIETLISNGANVDVINNYGVSPKGLAETIANYDTKKFFR
jgi:ankyrin repeat protein